MAEGMLDMDADEGLCSNEAFMAAARAAQPQNVGMMPNDNLNEAVAAGRAQQVSRTLAMYSMMPKMLREISFKSKKLVESVNIDEISRQVNQWKFTKFKEDGTIIYMKGVKLYDETKPVGDPAQYPYNTVISELCQCYGIPKKIKKNMLNSGLARENSALMFDFKFNVGETGNFFYGKFQAMCSNGEIDFMTMFYNLQFALKDDVIKDVYQKKFLGFTIGQSVNYRNQAVTLTNKDIEQMQIYFKSRMYTRLSDDLTAFAISNGEMEEDTEMVG